MMNLESAIKKDEKNKDRITFIYFIKKITNKGKVGVKIGTTVNLLERLEQHIRTDGSPVYLYGVLYGGYVKEREYHNKYKEYNICKEVFKLNKEQIKEIEKECNAEENLINYEKYISEYLASDHFRISFNYNREVIYIVNTLKNIKRKPIDRINKYFKGLKYKYISAFI